MEFLSLAKEIHENAKEKGWWDKPRDIPELLCLVHSEVSEALEAYRNFDTEEFERELADIVIRVFDMAVALNIDIQQAVVDKHLYNTTRSFKHGGKRI